MPYGGGPVQRDMGASLGATEVKLLEYTTTKLSDVVYFQEGPGVRKWDFHEEGTRIMNIRLIQPDGTLEVSDSRFVSDEFAFGKWKHFLLDEDDIIVSSSGSIGKRAWVRKQDLPLMLNTSVIRFRPIDESVIDRRYLWHFLGSNQFLDQIHRMKTGSAQVNFGPSHLKKVNFSYPSLIEQRRIATILDKIDETDAAINAVNNSKQKLIRSTFLDMFGDMITNPMNWPIMKLGEVCDSQLGKAISREAKLCKNPSKYLRNANVQWRNIEFHDLKEMDFKDSEKEKLTLYDGDVLATEGGDVGRCAIWKYGSQDIYFQNSLHRIRVNRGILTPEYLVEYFAIMSERGGLIRETTQVTIAHLTGQKLKKLPIPLPPLDLQHKFTQILNNIQSLSNENIRHSEILHRSINQMMLS